LSEPSRFKLFDYVESTKIWLSGGTAQAALPDNIRVAINKQQDSSERLIGGIQLVILIVFSFLYLAAPTTSPDNSMFAPVPLFLGAYFIFSCMRLYLAYRTSLGVWILLLSVFVDMGLLIGLIWSFHIQYVQPPAFYLKAPTLLYIFIFIALRALRFAPGYVIVSGLVGAAGWLFLVWFAIRADAETSVITSDYVLYLTSNRVLLGAEIDKIISIMLVAIILALVVARARTLLISSIVEGTNAQNLSHFVPESVADRIAQTEGPLREAQSETCEASILFVDLISFTGLAERLTPEDLILTLNEYFSVIAEPIERHGGVINQFQGDAILASFNLPSKDQEHASSAVAAALEIQAILRTHTFYNDVVLSTRAGVNTGTVVGGFVGTKNRLSYTVYGDDVNIAARLQELSKKKNVSNLVSFRTRQLCNEERFDFAPMGSEIVRGRQTTVEVFEASFKPVP